MCVKINLKYLKWSLGGLWRELSCPFACHQLPQTGSNHRAPPRGRCPITTPAGGRKVFSWPSTSPAPKECHSSANSKSLSPPMPTYLQRAFVFSLLITSLPYPSRYKSFPFCVTLGSIPLLDKMVPYS